MEILLVIEILLFMVVTIIAYQVDSEAPAIICFFLTGCIIATLICLGIEWGKPQAMDVYRGNTTLEITYKDSVAVDSVVVFKDKYQ